MANINSSDGLVSDHETPMNPNIGKRALASIAAASVTDRLASKQTVKSLKYRGRAPGTTHQRMYYWQLFTKFLDDTLHVKARADKTPTADDLLRFVAQLPGHIQARRRDGVPAWMTIKTAEYAVEVGLQFHYPSFTMSTSQARRLDVLIQTMLDEGKITKDPFREKQWLTCEIMKRMTAAVLANAIDHGTKCWDITVANALSLVMQSALSSRSGDFKKSLLYADEFLKWEHIVLAALGDRANPKLTMVVTLNHCKGWKRDAQHSMKVTLGQLEDADSTLDVTKLLIAHALRTGAVEQTSWATLIDAVLRRPSRKFIWTKPTAPVFWRYRKGGRAIDFSGPAPVRQQYQIVRLAAELTGMLEVPTTHDVRRGAASDTAGLTLKPSTTDAVRQSLGHSMSVMNRGLTEAYIGRQKTDMWASRVKNAPTVESPGLAVPDPFGVTIATQPFKKRRVVVEDVDRYCDDHKLDKTKKTARMAASRELGKMQREVWVSQQRAVLDGDGSAESDRPPLKDVTNIAVGTSTSDNGRRPSKASPDDSTEAIDPRLRVFSQALGMEDADGRNDESMNEALAETFEVLQELEEANGGTMPTVLTADIDTYIGYLSTANLVATSSELGNLTDSGNSRDPPSLFVYSCDGCGRTFDTPNRLAKHQANCAGATFHTTDATTALDDVQTDDVDGVATATDDAAVQPTAASKKRKRKSMKGVVDEGFPKQCPDMAECGETKMFTNKKNLSNHRLAHHDKNWPTVPCNVPFCLLPPTHLFKSRKTFRTHLRSTHHLNEQQGLEYIGKIVELKGKVPKSLRESFVPTKCLFPGCTSTTVYQDYENYAWHHLHDVHHLTSNDYPAYLPGSRTTTSTD